mgnify:FL=1
MDKNNVASSIGALVGTQSTAAQVMARYRATAKEYGRFFGEQIYTVVATNPDLKWKEDVLNDKNTLRKEVNVFIVKAIDILDVKFIAKDLDGEPKIMLNPDDNDPNLVFRYCSKCEGDYEYCQDHLYTHKHVTKGGMDPRQANSNQEA